MGYRINEHKPPRPHRSTEDVSTPARIYVHNGTLAHFAFPCFYQEAHKPMPAILHNKHLHDYLGWPSPDKADHSCQLDGQGLPPHYHHRHPHGPFPPRAPFPWHLHYPIYRYVDLGTLIPIHLLKEGYSKIQVSFNASDDETGLTIVNAFIDQTDDWVIRVDLLAEAEDALTEPKKYKMSVFAIADDRKDLAVLADLIILPSSYVEEDLDAEQ